ncbi:peptidoglycan editing factor PgeF [Myxococcota bacterium]
MPRRAMHQRERFSLTQDVDELAPIALVSPLLAAAGFRHAFFTRLGGVSQGSYESLNCSFSVGDVPHKVEQNLTRVARYLDLDPLQIFWLTQVHGRQVRRIGSEELTDKIRQQEGDAIISRARGLGCAVRVADCVPVLLGEQVSGAVAAVHAGWRGVVRGVLSAAIQGLETDLARRGDWVAAIGPHISVEAFEVSPDVAESLRRASPAGAVLDHSLGPRPRANLRRIVRAQLEQLGVPGDQVDDIPGCTFGQPQLFFSFRRDGPKSGRHLAAIVCRGPRA